MPRPVLATKVPSSPAKKKATLVPSSRLKREVCIQSSEQQISTSKSPSIPSQTWRSRTPNPTSTRAMPSAPLFLTATSPTTPSPSKRFPSRRITCARPSTPVTTPVTVEIKSSKYGGSRPSAGITKISLTPSPAKSWHHSSLPTTPLSFELQEVEGSIGRNGQFTPATRTPTNGKSMKFESHEVGGILAKNVKFDAGMMTRTQIVHGEGGRRTPKKKLDAVECAEELLGAYLGSSDAMQTMAHMSSSSERKTNSPGRLRVGRDTKVRTTKTRFTSGIQSCPASSTKRPAIVQSLAPLSNSSKPSISTLSKSSLRSPIRIFEASSPAKCPTLAHMPAAFSNEQLTSLFTLAPSLSPWSPGTCRPALSSKDHIVSSHIYDTPNGITSATRIPSTQHSLTLQNRNTSSENNPPRSVIIPGNLLKKTITLAKADMDPRRRLPESKGISRNVPEGSTATTPKKMVSTPTRSRVPVPSSAIKSGPTRTLTGLSVRVAPDVTHTPGKGVRARKPQSNSTKTPDVVSKGIPETPARINSDLYKPITHPRTPFATKTKNVGPQSNLAETQSPSPKTYEGRVLSAEHVAEMVRMWNLEDKAEFAYDVLTQPSSRGGSTTPPFPTPNFSSPPSSLWSSSSSSSPTPTRMTPFQTDQTFREDEEEESHTPKSTPTRPRHHSPDLLFTNLFIPRTRGLEWKPKLPSPPPRTVLSRVRSGQEEGQGTVRTPSKETARALDHAIDRHLKDELRHGRVATPGGQKLSELLRWRGV